MNKGKNWFWGIFLLLAGVLVVVSQVTGFSTVGFWSVVATVALVAIFIQSIIKLNFFFSLLSLALIYIIYMEPLKLFYIQPWLLILAVVLVSIGLSILIRKKPKYSGWGGGHWENGTWYEGDGSHWHGGSWVSGDADGAPPADGADPANADDPNYTNSYSDAGGTYTMAESNSVSDDDNQPTAKVTFGASNRYLHSTALERGYFKVSFGAMEVYFAQAKLAPEGAEIFLDCSFGAIKLYIPRNWNVEESISASLGGVGNDTRFARPDRSLPPLRLTGNVSLGAVEVEYV